MSIHRFLDAVREVRLLELFGAGVDRRNEMTRRRGILPSSELQAGIVQKSAAERQYRLGFLRQGDEASRRYEPFPWMLRTQQGFGARDVVIRIQCGTGSADRVSCSRYFNQIASAKLIATVASLALVRVMQVRSGHQPVGIPVLGRDRRDHLVFFGAKGCSTRFRRGFSA
jgi:hypothetical protein